MAAWCSTQDPVVSMGHLPGRLRLRRSRLRLQMRENVLPRDARILKKLVLSQKSIFK